MGMLVVGILGNKMTELFFGIIGLLIIIGISNVWVNLKIKIFSPNQIKWLEKWLNKTK